jgi:DNA-directed RNA polymerase specialized sigma24 family protein
MAAPGPSDSQWLISFADLCQDLLHSPSQETREDSRTKVWLLLNSAIAENLRFHSSRLGRISREDAEDIAAQKSSDLLRKLELRMWEVTGRSPAEISGFLSKVARNGLVDQLREYGRWVDLGKVEPSGCALDAAAQASAGCTAGVPEPPENRVASREYAAALRRCAEELDIRSRRAWFLRVLCEMPSKRIAAHPQVSTSVNHVDVLLHRARHAVRKCMRRKGHEPSDMPPGTFVALWESCDFDNIRESAGVIS